MNRSVASAIISFGLIRIPVKFYTSAMAETVKFSLLSPKGNRIERLNFDASTGEEIAYEDCDRGHEVAKDEFVRFTKAELEALENEACDIMEIKEFIPASLIHPIMVEKTYYLGPDLGADKGYCLLHDALLHGTDEIQDGLRAAVAQWVVRGKEHLVVIARYGEGLILHQMFYSHEVRSFEDVLATRQPHDIGDVELRMAGKLIAALTTHEYVASEYQDRYAIRVKEAIRTKVLEGKTLKLPAEGTRHPQTTKSEDLSTLLKQSLDQLGKKPQKMKKKLQTAKPKKGKRGKRGKKHVNGAQMDIPAFSDSVL